MSPKAGYSTIFCQSELAPDMPGVFIAEAAQPSLKLKQLPTFYAFSAGLGIMLMSVARRLHFWGSKLLCCRYFRIGWGWNPPPPSARSALLWITAHVRALIGWV